MTREKRRSGRTPKRPGGKADLGCLAEAAGGAVEAGAEVGLALSRPPCQWRAASRVRLVGCNDDDEATPTTPSRVDISGSPTFAHLRRQPGDPPATPGRAASENRRPTGMAATASRSALRPRPDVAADVGDRRARGTTASRKKQPTER